MRTLTIILALVTLGGTAFAAEKRPHVVDDACAKQTATCEKGCDAKAGMDRLSCKTDCRLVETQCRNKKLESPAAAPATP